MVAASPRARAPREIGESLKPPRHAEDPPEVQPGQLCAPWAICWEPEKEAGVRRLDASAASSLNSESWKARSVGPSERIGGGDGLNSGVLRSASRPVAKPTGDSPGLRIRKRCTSMCAYARAQPEI